MTVHERLVLIHCKKHLAGTVERARIAHRFLVFEDVGLVSLIRRLVPEPEAAVTGPLDPVGKTRNKILVRPLRKQVTWCIILALRSDKQAVFNDPSGIAAGLPAGQVPAIEQLHCTGHVLVRIRSLAAFATAGQPH